MRCGPHRPELKTLRFIGWWANPGDQAVPASRVLWTIRPGAMPGYTTGAGWFCSFRCVPKSLLYSVKIPCLASAKSGEVRPVRDTLYSCAITHRRK